MGREFGVRGIPASIGMLPKPKVVIIDLFQSGTTAAIALEGSSALKLSSGGLLITTD